MSANVSRGAKRDRSGDTPSRGQGATERPNDIAREVITLVGINPSEIGPPEEALREFVDELRSLGYDVAELEELLDDL